MHIQNEFRELRETLSNEKLLSFHLNPSYLLQILYRLSNPLLLIPSEKSHLVSNIDAWTLPYSLFGQSRIRPLLAMTSLMNLVGLCIGQHGQ
jgi:hypothetical protein